jgi:hypothetical protein
MANNVPAWATKVRKNEATAARRRFYFHCVDVGDHHTPEAGEAGGQPEISIDGAAWTSDGGVIGVLVDIGDGDYYADASQAAVNLNAGTILARYKSGDTDETLAMNVLIVGAEGDNAPNLSNATRNIGFTAGEVSIKKADGSTEDHTITLGEVDDDNQSLTRA